MKSFDITGTCRPNERYMLDITKLRPEKQFLWLSLWVSALSILSAIFVLIIN